MHILKNLNEWRYLRAHLAPQETLGFIPTMGNLHVGHLSLVHQSQAENHQTLVSIFVNPTQFNQPDDFIHYPRTLDSDLASLERAGVSYCLLPDEKAIYPDAYRYQLQENEYSLMMEGRMRPGHFTGMLTIVMKLLNLVQPNCVYFGEKDYQQFELVQGMITAFFLKVDIKLCPTVRESSGLAYSSRNARLNAEERMLAERFASIFHQNLPCETICAQLQDHGIMIDYVEELGNRRFAAVKIGQTRLIDNYKYK